MARTLRFAQILAIAALLLTFLVAAMLWRGGRPGGPRPSAVIPPVPGGDVAILVGAGDIAECGDDDDERTAAIVERIPGTVFFPGDAVYPDGTLAEYRDCYGPSWGRFLDRTRPAPGDHEYITPGAAGYREYFGPRAIPRGTTWYSWDERGWHVIVLDSECQSVGGCDPASPQGHWLQADLEASRARCTMAIFHYPRFSSGFHGDEGAANAAPFWDALHAAGAEIVVNGNDHDYERFAPQDPAGRADPDRGIREFVVGTGGARLRPFLHRPANSEVRNDRTHGVIRFALRDGGYAWDFIPVGGESFSDSGSGTCH
ncbi:MAG TPA: hypothetical protein VH723_08065 [Candidatus Limnocylindrales bacterium]